MTTLFDLTGKNAIITGSSRGIGKAIALRMAAHGAKVIITSRNIKLAKKKIPIKSKNLILKQINILNLEEIKKLILENKPNIIFYFASQSSPKLSFINKKETYQSNYIGCQNFFKIILLIY